MAKRSRGGEWDLPNEPLRVKAREEIHTVNALQLLMQVARVRTKQDGSSQPGPSSQPVVDVPISQPSSQQSRQQQPSHQHGPPNPLMMVTAPCTHCGKVLMDTELRQCDGCQDVFCSVCSLVDYQEREDRIFCLECYENEGQPGGGCHHMLGSVAAGAGGGVGSSRGAMLVGVGAGAGTSAGRTPGPHSHLRSAGQYQRGGAVTPFGEYHSHAHLTPSASGAGGIALAGGSAGGGRSAQLQGRRRTSVGMPQAQVTPYAYTSLLPRPSGSTPLLGHGGASPLASGVAAAVARFAC